MGAGRVGADNLDILAPRLDERALHHLVADGVSEENHDVRRSDLITKSFRHLRKDLRPTRIFLT